MKHCLTLLLALSFLSINGQTTDNSTLWKISGNGLEHPSYLFGTIHITCDASLDASTTKALEETSQIILEIDMDDPSLQQKMMGGMYMKGGKTLKDYVSEDEFKIIDSLFIKTMGMSIKTMQNVKPFFLATMLYPKMIDCPMQSFELELMKVAKAQNEDIKGLETVEDQIQLFDDIPYEDQVADLLRMAKDNLAHDKALFAKMLKIYDEENISGILDIVNEDTNSSMYKYQDKLIFERNRNWVSKIESFSKSEPTFFGVGAGHLGGEQGVITLLRNAGYTLTAIP